MNFFEVFNESEEFKRLLNSLDNTPVSVSGIVESALAHFIVSTGENKKKLVVVNDEEQAKNLLFDMRFFTDKVVYFPKRDLVYYNIDAYARFNEYKRINSLNEIINNDEIIVITTLEALRVPTIPKNILKNSKLEIKSGQIYDIEELIKTLVNLGYTRDDVCEGCGQFSVRGGIIDIYSPSDAFPYRIEFFDNEVDSVRIFDYVSQRTMEMVDCATVLPCREILFDSDRAIQISDKINAQIEKLKKKKGEDKELIDNITQEADAILTKRTVASIDKYYSYVYDDIYTLLDYFDDAYIFEYEPKRISEKAKEQDWEMEEKLKNLIQRNLILPQKNPMILDFSKYLEKSEKMHHISLNSLNHTSVSYKYKALFDFKSRATVSLHGKIDYLFSDLEAWQKENATVIILAKNRSRGENIAGVLADHNIDASFINDSKEFKKGKISVVMGELKKGFEYYELGFVVISEKEIFDTDKKRKMRKIENTKRLKSYQDINIGDYVVHQAHGIGRYEGIKRMNVSGVLKDYLKIQYKGSDSLYVPVDQMDLLYKYVGNTEKELKLNKLGGTDWSKTKTRVKQSTKDIARELVKLYAERMQAKGYAFSEDGPWQRDFEDGFGYDETDDQLRSIEEVKQDMESQKPMDRLLCGDVGYGKTEVAIRAAFKASVDSKQVAYLCPTTVLAMQHYDTFKKRMEDYAIRVEMLSRFRTPTQQKKILKDLKNGTIDIIIGTHRLLSKDIEFKDLGLLIIDEEQRFGVKHKEKLKELKKNIDVLSMTATPIPRTLHMSMINVRDMSVLETPPENRYPVETYVMEYNEPVLVDAMKRELSRGGQVFFLNNRVENIYSVANRIAELIPDANVAVGHGKMNETELEDIMYDMVNGKTDILVCTTIIETGLDISNANTIIVNNADRMGLSQLYQLRGRVGRSNRSAYAYLTYKPDKILSEVAEKRLRAIKEFTEFGSGFKIAMRDLEIRGAGNLLGAEQHGHMDLVGYDMYCKILKESVDEITGKEVEKELTTSVDFALDAYIPERYISNQNLRIDIYKKIALIESEEDITEILDELCDRFGDVPTSVTNLVNISYLKSLANKLGIIDINAKKTTVTFKFANEYIDPELCVALICKIPDKITVSSSAVPTIIYRNTEPAKLIDNIKFVLQMLMGLKNEKK